MPLAPLLYVVLTLLILGVLLWGIARLPGDDAVKAMIRVIVIVVVAIWLLIWLFSFLPGGLYFPLPRR